MTTDDPFNFFRLDNKTRIRILVWSMASIVGVLALVFYIDPDKAHRERTHRERAEFYKRFVQDIKAAGLAGQEEGTGELDKRPVITGKVATFLWAERSGTFESEKDPDNPNTYADTNPYIPEDLHPKGDASSVGTVIWLTVTYGKAGSYSNGVVAYRQMCRVQIIDPGDRKVLSEQNISGTVPDQINFSWTQENEYGGDVQEVVLDYISSLPRR